MDLIYFFYFKKMNSEDVWHNIILLADLNLLYQLSLVNKWLLPKIMALLPFLCKKHGFPITHNFRIYSLYYSKNNLTKYSSYINNSDDLPKLRIVARDKDVLENIKNMVTPQQSIVIKLIENGYFDFVNEHKDRLINLNIFISLYAQSDLGTTHHEWLIDYTTKNYGPNFRLITSGNYEYVEILCNILRTGNLDLAKRLWNRIQLDITDKEHIFNAAVYCFDLNVLYSIDKHFPIYRPENYTDDWLDKINETKAKYIFMCRMYDSPSKLNNLSPAEVIDILLKTRNITTTLWVLDKFTKKSELIELLKNKFIDIEYHYFCLLIDEIEDYLKHCLKNLPLLIDSGQFDKLNYILNQNYVIEPNFKQDIIKNTNNSLNPSKYKLDIVLDLLQVYFFV